MSTSDATSESTLSRPKFPVTQPKHQTLSVAMQAYRDMLTDSIPEQVADLQPILG